MLGLEVVSEVSLDAEASDALLLYSSDEKTDMHPGAFNHSQAISAAPERT